jgi:hypothetical protein
LAEKVISMVLFGCFMLGFFPIAYVGDKIREEVCSGSTKNSQNFNIFFSFLLIVEPKRSLCNLPEFMDRCLEKNLEMLVDHNDKSSDPTRNQSPTS